MRRAAGMLMILIVWTAGCGGAREREQVDAALRQAVAARTRPAFVTPDAEGRKLWKLTQQFYERREFAPAWIDGTDPTPRMGELIDAVAASREDGLQPELYGIGLLDARRREASKGFLSKKGFDPAEAGRLDTWFTYVYLKFASDLADGVSDLAHADPAWQIRPEKFDASARLEKALAGGGVGDSLRKLMPDNPQYVALRRALATHKAAAAKDGWPTVPALRVKPGQRSPHLDALARRLAGSGDYDGAIPAAGSTVYGGRLVEAVKHFQARHGLSDTGTIDAPTVAELNIPLTRRIAQIEINLERWRWLPRDLGSRYVLVNIPEYRLEVWDGGRVPLSMRVVVGKQDTPTPIFNDEMTYLVFSPYWNVPPDIATGETLPAVMKDPGFLERTNMEVLDAAGQPVDPASIDLDDPTKYRFRQRPGADNSLGLVKFMFPNQYNVYLHDTPADSLFARASRSFSHGCVRLEQPLALAEYVLRDQPAWTREKISEAMHAEEERVVKLREPLPVYLGYWTARVSADGVLQFRKDVYGTDARLAALLDDRLARLRKTAAAAALAADRGQTVASLNGSSIE